MVRASHFAGFFSTATDLHPADTDPGPDVYVKDVVRGDLTTRRSDGQDADPHGDAETAREVGDG